MAISKHSGLNRIKLNNSWIITFTLILVLTFVYLVISFYQTALRESKENHQKAQLEMAKSASAGVYYFLDHLIKDMQRQAYSQDLLSEKMHLDQHFLEEAVQAQFTTNKNLEIDYQEGIPLPYWVKPELPRLFSQLADERGNPNAYIFSRVMPADSLDENSPMYFLIVIPITHAADLPIDGRQPQYLSYLIRFDWLMDKFISPLRLGESDFAWVMDKKGRLIYHPSHEDMLLRNIFESEGDCIDCHKTFRVQKEMLHSNSGIKTYHIKGEPEKIMAYNSIVFSGQTWKMAISTYLPAVVKATLSNLIIIFFISSVFLILLIVAGVAFYFVNLNRIKAVETEKRVDQVQSIQEKLDQAAKLASIGELVDSVAHEINTPTGVIATVTDTMSSFNCANKNCFEDLDVIKRQVSRIKNYTKSLLNFSRRLPFQAVTNDLEDLIDECIFLVGPKLRSNRVKLEKYIPNDLKYFIFDRTRIEQVFINLLNNAIDFVAAKGQISIRVSLDAEDARLSEAAMVVIAISDNGKGIPEKEIAMIFEPFFSTKPLSKGTGLGLPISKAIIERHGGHIKVESAIGVGSTFYISLPFKREA